mgnify:CR=1 FL=1
MAINEKFFSSLTQQGYDIVKKFSFPDHHKYSDKQIEDILKYKKVGISVVTTAKDYVKIAPKYQQQIEVLEIGTEFSDQKLIKKLVEDITI